MAYLQTKKCIMEGCNNNATNFTGHLHRDNGDLIDAGFCDEHRYRAHNPAPDIKPIKNCKMPTGCFGEWRIEQGWEIYEC